MKAWTHLSIAGALVFGTAFFTWIWIISGIDCLYSCGFNPGTANLSFFSLGILCAFMAVTELITALKTGPLHNIPAQRRIRSTGGWPMLAGSLICFAGFYELNNTWMLCPSNGCPPGDTLITFGPFWALFYVGMLIVAFGGLKVVQSRFTKPPNARTTKLHNST